MAHPLRSLRVHAARPRASVRRVFLAARILSLSTKAARAHRMEYQDAVRALNSLQTNASALEHTCEGRSQPQVQLQAMRDFLRRSGLTVEDLDSLNIIHVAGTKGKGSTCAFTERILRNYGFRTGFYSSPHLVQVRERVRIDGQPIGKELFTKYFWSVYGQLDESKDAYGGSMPSYFRFLTLLAFHVFLQEKVNGVVNPQPKNGEALLLREKLGPWVCGISSLGIDHTSILGDTIEKIAWQKAGILKPGVPAFTVAQPPGPMVVLRERAREIGCPLLVCPELDEYESPGPPLRLGLAGHHQRSNATLALQLCRNWLQRRGILEPLVPYGVTGNRITPGFHCRSARHPGLAETEWPGRSHTIRHGPLTYFLDGAHTTGSVLACVRWFRKEAATLERTVGGPVVRVLLFNATGERDSGALLKLLWPCHFDFAVFCPNLTESVASCSIDQQNFNVTLENMLTRCLDSQSSWRTLSGRGGRLADDQLVFQNQLPLVAEQRTDSLVFPCILSALQWISQGRDPVLGVPDQRVAAVQPGVAARAQALQEAASIQVLITGSLYLVGGALTHLVPSLAS
uniref:Folylpolyglutamate synthase n=1 Tax=Scleropages formosus TaxID=113540 RepID=A0A8C9T6J8_SCLFO